MPEPEEKPQDDKAQRNLQNLLAKQNGDAVALAAQLLAENADYRQKNRDLKASQTPADAVVLTGDDAAKWTAFNELGTPAEVKARLAEAASAADERDALKAEKTIAHAATLSGFKSDVLSDLAKSKGFKLDVTGEGENAQAIVRYKDGENEVVKPLSEYAESSLSVYLPSLKSEAAETKPQGVPFPRSAAPGGGATLSLADQIRAEEAAKKAPQGEAVKVPTLQERMNLAPA